MKKTTTVQMNMVSLMCGMDMCGMIFCVEKFQSTDIFCMDCVK